MAAYASTNVYAYISGAWVLLHDISGAVPTSGSWGMGDNNPLTRVANTGVITVTLNNSTGIYSPGGVNALAGWKKGVPLKMVITFEGESKEFKYYISDIDAKSNVRDKQAVVTALDWLDFAARHPIVNPGIQTNKRGDEVLTTLLGLVEVDPDATEFDIGVETFPTAFDTVTSHTKAFTEAAKVALSELGYVYLKKDGTLVFESSSHRGGWNAVDTIPVATENSGFLLKEDGGYLLLETGGKIVLNQSTTTAFSGSNVTDYDAPYGKHVINRLTVYANPRKLSAAPEILFTLNEPISIGSGQTITIKGTYANPSGGLPINAISSTMIAPVASSTDTFTKSLLHFNGANASTTFTDDSGKTWTAISGAKIDTALSWQGGASGLFNGSTDYIQTPSHADFNFGSGDFTVDWWEYRTDAANAKCSITRNPAGGAFASFQFGYSDGTNLRAYMSSNGTGHDITAGGGASLGVISLNQWVHLAVVRSGTTFYCFKNGALTSSWTSAAALFTDTSVMVIGVSAGTGFYAGRIDEFRVSKGVARWTAAFAPSTYQYSYTFAIGGDYQMNTAADGSGSDITSYLAVSAVYGTEGFTHQVVNNYSGTGYITKYNCRGTGIYIDNPIEHAATNAASIAEFKTESDSINQAYKNDLSSGSVFAESVVDEHNQPRTVLNSITFCANRSGANMIAFLYAEIGSLHYISMDDEGLSGNYYIQGIEFRMLGGIIMCKWIVSLALSLLAGCGLSSIAVETGGYATGDAVNFGYLPKVYSNNTPETISMSAWIYADSFPANVTQEQSNIMGFTSDSGGIRMRFKYLNPGCVSVYHNIFNTFPGQWHANTAISAGSWYLVTFTMDISSTANYPVIYINAVSQAITEDVTPAGSKFDKLGIPIVIGAHKTATIDYIWGFDGKIFDPRIYNRILTAAEVTTLYNGGTPDEALVTDGLVFQGFAVRTGSLASYIDQPLTAALTLRDNIYGSVGVVHSSPIGRVAP
jgi:hypothetical protein